MGWTMTVDGRSVGVGLRSVDLNQSVKVRLRLVNCSRLSVGLLSSVGWSW